MYKHVISTDFILVLSDFFRMFEDVQRQKSLNFAYRPSANGYIIGGSGWWLVIMASLLCPVTPKRFVTPEIWDSKDRVKHGLTIDWSIYLRVNYISKAFAQMAIPRFQRETSIFHCQVSLPCVASHQKRLRRETEHLPSEKMSWRCVHPQVNFPTKHLDSQLNQTKGLSLKFSNAEIQLRINTSPSPATQSWNLYSRHREVFSMQSNLRTFNTSASESTTSCGEGVVV